LFSNDSNAIDGAIHFTTVKIKGKSCIKVKLTMNRVIAILPLSNADMAPIWFVLSVDEFSSPFYPKQSRLYTIVSTTQWFIWRAYWSHIFDDKPFLTMSIIHNITRQIAILLGPVPE
jgi:hypothetical protein